MSMPTENLHISSDNVRSAGGDLDSVWVGKLGAVMPDEIEDPPNHENVGWLNEDGIEFGHDDNVEPFPGHQGGKIVRKKVTSSEDTFKFTALESTALIYGLVHDIRSRETTDGVVDAGKKVTRMKISGSKKPNDRRSWVVDLWDGDIWERYLIPSGDIGERYLIPSCEIVERPTVPASISGLKMYEVTHTVYGSYDILTNDPAQIAEAGSGN